MMAISIPQPDAWLVVRGYKKPANRSWRLQHRGSLLIHAGARIVTIGEYVKFVTYCRSLGIKDYPTMNKFELGGIIGQIDVVDSCKVEFPGIVNGREYEIIAENACVFSFEPMKGRRKLWYVEDFQPRPAEEGRTNPESESDAFDFLGDERVPSRLQYRDTRCPLMKITSTAGAIATLGERTLNRERSLHGV